MAGRCMVTDGGGLRVHTWPGMRPVQRAELTGAGALCASGGALYAASDAGEVIWRLDAHALRPTGAFAGGPGMAQLAASGGRLYALCADGDSLLMLDAATGAPLALTRVGANPASMHMGEGGRVIAVAGGERGVTALLDARTLHELARLDMPGMALCAAMHGGRVATLCLNEALDATLVTDEAGGGRRTLALGGMPGALLPCGGALLAATQGRLYAVSPDGARVLSEIPAPGRARRLCFDRGHLLLLDGLGEALYALHAGVWRRVAGAARDVLLTRDDDAGDGAP